tara:strand:+ start:834 stop:1079 length:246 start_codon:yes stop_codon:yes gene_type:complete
MESNNNKTILKHINDIEETVKKLNKEKEKIQSECKHQEGTYINFDEEKSIKKFCSTCKRDIGYASKREEHDFLRPKGQQNT